MTLAKKVSQAAYRCLTNRQLQFWVVCGLFVSSLLPLLLIARFAIPNADDFSYGNYTVFAWRETRQITQTISAAIEGTRSFYNNWQGTFAAIFFMTLQPGIFAEEMYFVGVIALIIGYAASTMFLLKVIFMNFLGADKFSYGIIASWFTFISMQFIYSPVEGFFWYNAGLLYIGFHSFSLILFAIVLLSLKAENKYVLVAYSTLIAVLSFLVGGGNYLTALTSSIILGLFVVYCLIWKRNRFFMPLIGLLLMCTSLMISVSAPGNMIRQALFEGFNPIFAILISFDVAYNIVTYLVQPMVWIAFACIVPLIYKITKDSNIKFRYPGLVTIMLFGVYASTFTPNLYAWAGLGEARVFNIYTLAILFFLLFSITYWCGWIAKNTRFASISLNRKKPTPLKKTELEPTRKPNAALICIVSILIGILMIQGITQITNDPNSMMSVSAARSLRTGEARVFHDEYLFRLSILRNPEISDAVLPAFTAPPHVLFFGLDDISTDPNHWINTSMAMFYGKDSVVLQSPAYLETLEINPLH